VDTFRSNLRPITHTKRLRKRRSSLRRSKITFRSTVQHGGFSHHCVCPVLVPPPANIYARVVLSALASLSAATMEGLIQHTWHVHRTVPSLPLLDVRAGAMSFCSRRGRRRVGSRASYSSEAEPSRWTASRVSQPKPTVTATRWSRPAKFTRTSVCPNPALDRMNVTTKTTPVTAE
jgi:hypothetical protein